MSSLERTGYEEIISKIENDQSAQLEWYVNASRKLGNTIKHFFTMLLTIDIVFLLSCIFFGINTVGFIIHASALALELFIAVYFSSRKFDVYSKFTRLIACLVFTLPLISVAYMQLVFGYEIILVLGAVRILILFPMYTNSFKRITLKRIGKRNVKKSGKTSYRARRAFLTCVALFLSTIFAVVTIGALAVVDISSGRLMSFSRRIVYEFDDESQTCTVKSVFNGLANLEIPEECTKLTTSGLVKYQVVGVKDHAFSDYKGDSVTLPATITSVGGGAFKESNIKKVTVLSSSFSFNDSLKESSVNEIYFEQELCKTDINSENIGEGLRILVKPDFINIYKNEYASISDRLCPMVNDDQLFVNFNNTVFDTLISQKNENGEITVLDPFNGSMDDTREENGRDYQFVWWNKKTDGQAQIVSFPYTTSESLNLYAEWMPIYLIDYVMDSGATKDFTVDSFYYSAGEVKLPTASLDGYTFMGWYDNEGLSGSKIEVISDSTPNDVTLYAKFLKNYNVSYDFGYDTDDGADYITIYHRENENIILPKPNRRGYQFKGWYNDSEFTSGIDKIVCTDEKDVSLFAKWEIVHYTINYIDADLVSGLNTNILTYTVEDADITLSGLSLDGYTFKGWYSDSSFESPVDGVAIASGSIDERSFYAKWEINTPSVFDEAGYSAIYDGSEHAISVNTSHLAQDVRNISYLYQWYFNGDAITEPTENSAYNVLNVLDSGIYQCYVTATDGKYSSEPISSAGISVSIERASYDMSQISFNDASFEFDGNPHNPVILGTLPVGYDGIAVTVSYQGAITNVVQSGSIAVATFETESTNYIVPNIMTAKTTITPKEIVIDWCNDSFTYNGYVQSITASYKDVSNNDISLIIDTNKEFKQYDENGYIAVASFKNGETNYKLPSNPTKSYTINKLSIANAEITLGSALTYNTAQQAQSVIEVVVNDLMVTYDVVDNIATNAGDYTLTVIGNGNFTGEATKSFTIAPRSIEYGAVIELGPALTYNGLEQEQQIASVTVDGADVTYIVESNKGIAAKSYTLKITGTGNYTGSCEKNFTIARKDISLAEITLGAELTYNGQLQGQRVTSVIVDNLNATFTTSENTGKDAGTYTLKVTGTENFTGEAYKSFEIKRKNITGAQITLGSLLTYNGQMQTQSISSVIVDGLAVDYKVYNNTGFNANAYELMIEGVGNFIGNEYKSFEIKPMSIVGADVILGAELTYNGMEQLQNVASVTINGFVVDTYDVSGNNATNAGGYTLKITAGGNFTGSVNKQYEIKTMDITGAQITLGNNLIYNSKTQTQLISSVTVNGLNVTYTVENNTAKDAGDYTLTVKANGNFSGSVLKTFTVERKSISGASITLGTKLTYNGAMQSQGVTSVVIDGINATFTVTDNTATNAGTYELKVTGNGNFVGEATKEFEIARNNISYGSPVIELGPQLTYNGVEQEQIVLSVKLGDLDVDYYVENNKGTDAKSYKLKIVGQGNFTGTYEKAFTIARKNISGAEINLGPQLIYNGTSQSQEIVSVIIDGIVVNDYTVSNNSGTDANKEYTIKIAGQGNFMGTIYKTFVISPLDISEATVVLGPQLTYNGTNQVKTVESVSIGGMDVTYTVSNATAKDAGEYTLTINATGNFTGSVSKQYTIATKDISGAAVNLGASLTYNGEEQTQLVTSVIIDGMAVEFTVENNKATDAGKYTLTVKGTGNFSGSVTVAFEIAKIDISSSTPVITLGPQLTYNGSQQEQAVLSVKLGDLNVDYLVENNKGTDAMTYNLKIVGQGNFTGSCESSFSILPKNIDGAIIVLGNQLTYNGLEQTQDVLSVTVDGIEITNYTVSDNVAKDAGEHWLTIKANDSNLTGETTARFEILKLSISGAVVELDSEELIYDGEEKVKLVNSVTVGSMTLEHDVDYFVLNNAQIEAGEYTMKIVGIGNFDGEISIQWSIVEKTDNIPESTPEQDEYQPEENEGITEE